MLFDLLPLLQRLDSRLEHAIAVAQTTLNAESATDPAPEWSIAQTDLPPLHSDQSASIELPPNWVKPESPLARLQQMFDLSIFDLEIIAIALAPELDRRYSRVYAFLQEDVRYQRPTIDLALNLLCASVADKLTQRTRFYANAPLIQHGLIHLVNSHQTNPTLLDQELVLDDSVIRFLLHQSGLDRRLTPFCQLLQPQRSPDDLELTELQRSLITLIAQDWQAQHPQRFYFQGRDQSGKRHLAEALATESRAALLMSDLTQLDSSAQFESTLKLLFREAQFQNALLYIEGIDILQRPESATRYACFLNTLTSAPGITILSGLEPWIPATTEPLSITTISFSMPDFARCCAYWQHHLRLADIALPDSDLDALANRFRLTFDQIHAAIALATLQARLRGESSPTLTDLFEAARAQSGHDLHELASKIKPKYDWTDLVLPSEQLTLLKELCNQAKYRYIVYEEWGFGQKLSLGKGLNALFTGLPGTGKTMAAEVIAHELQLDLYKIDLSQIVSKYIGETEKNLNRIFTAAANSNAILLFDEADALFGKRSEVQDAHDRYANLEIGYLLQKMEEYEGISILTTNLRNSIDDAFIRRLRYIIEFSLPTVVDRCRIWQQIFPTSTPCSPELDWDFLAQQFEITGANIRNIALAAAFLAADQDRIVKPDHVMQAIRQEYQKMGKILIEKPRS